MLWLGKSENREKTILDAGVPSSYIRMLTLNILLNESSMYKNHDHTHTICMHMCACISRRRRVI